MIDGERAWPELVEIVENEENFFLKCCDNGKTHISINKQTGIVAMCNSLPAAFFNEDIIGFEYSDGVLYLNYRRKEGKGRFRLGKIEDPEYVDYLISFMTPVYNKTG